MADQLRHLCHRGFPSLASWGRPGSYTSDRKWWHLRGEPSGTKLLLDPHTGSWQWANMPASMEGRKVGIPECPAGSQCSLPSTERPQNVLSRQPCSWGTPATSVPSLLLLSGQRGKEVSWEKGQRGAYEGAHVLCAGLSCDPTGSVFRDEFDLAILQLQENNRLEILKRKWWEGGRCPKEEDHRAKGEDAGPPLLPERTRAVSAWCPDARRRLPGHTENMPGKEPRVRLGRLGASPAQGLGVVHVSHASWAQRP